MSLTFNVEKQNEQYVAHCKELGISTQAITREKADFRLKLLISFYANTALELGYKIQSEELNYYIYTSDIKKNYYLH